MVNCLKYLKMVGLSMSRLYKLITIPLVIFITACNSKLEALLISLIPHPQVPKERSYIIQQVEFINTIDGTKLAGELTYPSKGKCFSALVLVSGHSLDEPPAGRDYQIKGHKFFLVISHLLTLRGYAILRYDNRGVKKSSGEYTMASDYEFSFDAAGALKWLRKDSGLQLASSGFLGHSQGGVKSLLAAELIDPDYIVSLAGIGVETVSEILLRQNQEINKAKGVAQSTTDQQTKELNAIFKILRTSKDRCQAKNALRKYAISKGVTNKKHIQKLINEYGSVWWFSEINRGSKLQLDEYDFPVLALFGSKDLLVSALVNEAPARNLLRHQNSEVYTFAGLNHLFQTAKKGIGPEEYWEIEITIEEKVIEKIDSWIQFNINATSSTFVCS